MTENKEIRPDVSKGHNPPTPSGEEFAGHAPTMHLQEGHNRPAMSGPQGPPPAPIPGIGNIARPVSSRPQQQARPPAEDS